MAEAGVATQGTGHTGLWKNIVVLAGAAVLAACSVVPKAPPKPVDTPPETPVDTANPPLPTDAARHRIALLVPLTGTNAGVGESIANAATMAVLDTGGQAIRVTTYDTATGAAAAAEKAVAEGNKLILGPLLAEDVRAVAPIGRAAKVPLISFSNDVSVAGQGAYIMGFVPTQSVDRIVAYAKSRGLTRFAGLVPNGTYGQRASTALIKAVEANGGQLVGVQNFDRSAGGIQAAVRKLASSSAYDALLIADSGRIALQVVPQIRKAGGANVRILGTELWNTEGSLAQNPAMHGAWFASVSDGLYNQLSTKYRARHGKAPFRLSSLGYDAVLLVTRIAKNWKVGTNFPVTQLLDAGGYAGIDGAFRFGPGSTAERALEVQQIDPGKFTVINAAPKSFGK